MGNTDMKAMAAGQMDRSGEGLTQAGKICGMISCLLSIVGIVVWVVIMIAAGIMGAAAAAAGN
jgi:hypothetical protein